MNWLNVLKGITELEDMIQIIDSPVAIKENT
jgi:hypothetical protein